MSDDQERNIPIEAIKAALPGADWSHFDSYVERGYEFLRTTLLVGKVYWWMRNAHAHALIVSPLTGQDAEMLKTVMEGIDA